MDAHERPLFDKILWWLATSTVFVRCKHLIARKFAEFFRLHHGVRPFYAACRFDELSRWSISCFLNTSVGKRFHNATTQIVYAKIDDHCVRRGDTGQILARWWRTVASSVDLDMPYWVMRSAPYRLIRMVIEMAHKAGPFFCCQFNVLHNRS